MTKKNSSEPWYEHECHRPAPALGPFFCRSDFTKPILPISKISKSLRPTDVLKKHVRPTAVLKKHIRPSPVWTGGGLNDLKNNIVLTLFSLYWNTIHVRMVFQCREKMVNTMLFLRSSNLSEKSSHPSLVSAISPASWTGIGLTLGANKVTIRAGRYGTTAGNFHTDRALNLVFKLTENIFIFSYFECSARYWATFLALGQRGHLL